MLVGSKLAGSNRRCARPLTLTAEQLAPFAGVYANPLTGAPQLVTLRQDTLVLGRANWCPALLPLTANRFKVMGQPVELEFRRGSAVQYIDGVAAPLAACGRRGRGGAGTANEGRAGAVCRHLLQRGAGSDATLVSASDSALVLKTPRGRGPEGAAGLRRHVRGRLSAAVYPGRAGRIDGMLMSSGPGARGAGSSARSPDHKPWPSART